MTDAAHIVLKEFLGGINEGYATKLVTKEHRPVVEKALRLLAAVEAGTHKVVPIKGTQEMHKAALQWYWNAGAISSDIPRGCLEAGLQAAPDFFGEDGK